MLTLASIKNDREVNAFIVAADKNLEVMGYTEHGFRHCGLVSKRAAMVLEKLGFSERDIELAAISGYLHDMGNAINRQMHAQMGAMLAKNILSKYESSFDEITAIMAAIGNHDEEVGHVVSPYAAALILADKSDVHRARVRVKDETLFDIHDRVNYAVEYTALTVNEKSVELELVTSSQTSPVLDYFEIFLPRMILCRRAAVFLGCEFDLVINGARYA